MATLGVAITTFLGFGNRERESQPLEVPLELALYRITAFAISCIFATTVGLIIRTHNYLGISPAAQVRKFREAGFTFEQARSIVLLKELGTQTGSINSNSVDSNHSLTELSVLFGHNASTDCEDLDPKNFRDVHDLLTAYKARGEPWSCTADVVETYVPTNNWQAALERAHSEICSQR